MSALLGKTEERIIGEILADIVNTTGITRISPGAKLRTFTEAVGKQLGLCFTRADVNLIQSFLSGASGKYLDYFGVVLAKPRYGIQQATVTSTFKNVKFYTEPSNFGSINGGSSILIPKNTIISSSPNESGITYKTIISTILNSSSSSQYISVKSTKEGQSGNVGVGELRYHNFINYIDYANGTLLVTNEAEISNGRDLEKDENYRYRLANALVGSEEANTTAIRLSVLNVPGIADLIMQPYSRGTGSFDIIIKSVSPTCSDALLAAAQEAIVQTTALGVLYVVRRPKEIGCSMSFTVYTKNVLTSDQQTELADTIKIAITEYINNLDIHENLDLLEIQKRVLLSDDRIKRMGTNISPFDSFYIYKPTRLEDNKLRYSLTQDYITAIDERVIIEEEEVSGDPISISFATV